MFGMKFEALCALLLNRGQPGLVSESVWVGGGQMSAPNVFSGDWKMRGDTLERIMVKYKPKFLCCPLTAQVLSKG